jgi:hypothetical protein
MKKTSIYFVTLLILFSCTLISERNISSIGYDLHKSNNSFSELYSAIDALEKPMTAQRTLLKFEKVTGGLTCSKTSNQLRGLSFHCSLNSKSTSHNEIYASLKVNEVALPSNRMTFIFVKQVAGLTCKKTNIIGQEPTFNCILHSNTAHKCVSFTEMCKATFCTGGHQLINQETQEVVDQFRHYDYGENTKEHCQSFL